MLLGLYRRRLDADRRLRMPALWSVHDAQSWLLFPLLLIPPCEQIAPSLYLLPVSDSGLRRILTSSLAPIDCDPTPEIVLDVLRAQACQKGLSPSLAGLLQTTRTAPQFALTQAQLKWLGCHGRTVVVTGSLTAGWIYSPTTWAKVQRSAIRASKKENHKPRNP
jgi:hypothetical protein